MHLRSPRRGTLGALWVCLCSLLPANGLAAPSSPALAVAERQALSEGQRIERPLSFTTGQGSYVGGVSYQVVESPPEVVLAALLDAGNLPSMLPRTRSARVVSVDAKLTRIELEQGSAPFIARYTIVVERSPDQSELRFWLDQRAPHDLRDVWGFFRAKSFGPGRTLLSVGAAVDLGPGILRPLLEPRVRSAVLASVTGVRDFVEPRRLALLGY
ncbi:MAG: SRPBCC family protein [Polyangiaceae bacterium]